MLGSVPATNTYQLNGTFITKILGNPLRSLQLFSLLDTWLEDFRQRGQIHALEGSVERGGLKHAMCHPRWHWSYNNMVAAPFFSPHTKQGRPSGTTANSRCIEPSIGRCHGAQFLECSRHSRPSLPSSNKIPVGDTSFTRKLCALH